MKKLITIACAMLCLLSYARTAEEVCAEYSKTNAVHRRAFLNNITTDEWRKIANLEIARNKTVKPSAFLAMMLHNPIGKNLKPLLSEYDGKFVTSGFAKHFAENKPNWFRKLDVGFKNMPESTLKIVERIGKELPITAEICKSVKGEKESVNLPQRLAIFAENYAAINYAADRHGLRWFPRWDFDKELRIILSHAQNQVKRHIREKGGSFLVGADGKNPVQDAIDPLLAALNRPRMQGLREWVAELFPDYAWTEPSWLSEGDLKRLMDDVFYGKKDLNKSIQGVLRVNLGVDGYNEFIKKYNN